MRFSLAPWPGREPLLVAGATLLLYFSGFFVLWAPLPLLYLSLLRNRSQWRISFIGILVATLLIYWGLFPLWLDPPVLKTFRMFGIAYLAFYLYLGFLLSLGVWERWKLFPLVARVSFYGMGGVLLAGFALQFSGLYDVSAFLQETVHESARMLETLPQQPEFADKRTDWLAFMEQSKHFVYLLPKLIPSFLFNFAVVVVLLNLGALRIFRKVHAKLTWLEDFPSWQVPHAMIWGVIGGGSAYFFNVYLLHSEWLKALALNLLLAGGFLYFLQGLAIVGFYVRRFSPLFRMLLYGLVFVFLHFGGVLLIGLGIGDTWFSFRKKNERSKGV